MTDAPNRPDLTGLVQLLERHLSQLEAQAHAADAPPELQAEIEQAQRELE